MTKKYIVINTFKEHEYIRDDRTTFGDGVTTIFSQCLDIEHSPEKNVLVKKRNNPNIQATEYDSLDDKKLQMDMYCASRGVANEGVIYKILLEVDAETNRVLAIHDRYFNQHTSDEPLTRVELPSFQDTDAANSLQDSKRSFMDALMSQFISEVFKKTEYYGRELYRPSEQTRFILAKQHPENSNNAPAPAEKKSSFSLSKLRSLFHKKDSSPEPTNPPKDDKAGMGNRK